MVTGSFILQSLPEIFAERMLNGALGGLVLAALAWVLLKALGRRSSSTRFAVWFVVLLAVAALPLVEAVSWRQAAVSVGSPKSAILIPGAWALYMFCAWAVIAIASLGRVALGLWQIRRLRANSAPLDADSLDPALWQALKESCKRPISLYVAPSVRVPMATGFFHPMIVLPAWALRGLSTDELRVVLLHEAAHLRRWDDWTNLAQKMLRAVFFFHPVVWWLEGKLALEREMACDDLVVAETSSPRAYAQCLVALAEKSLGRRNFALAQAAVNRMRHTSLRIRQILDGKRSRTTGVWKPAVGVAMASAVVCLFFVNETPKLIGFASPAGEVASEGKSPASVVGQAFHPAPPLVGTSALSITPLHANVRTVRPKLVAAPLRSEIAAKGTAVASVPPVAQMAKATQPSPSFATGEDRAGYRAVAFGTSETVYVVMQDELFTSAGDKVVRVNVYRLTVFYPEFYPSNPQKTLSKSI